MAPAGTITSVSQGAGGHGVGRQPGGRRAERRSGGDQRQRHEVARRHAAQAKRALEPPPQDQAGESRHHGVGADGGNERHRLRRRDQRQRLRDGRGEGLGARASRRPRQRHHRAGHRLHRQRHQHQLEDPLRVLGGAAPVTEPERHERPGDEQADRGADDDRQDGVAGRALQRVRQRGLPAAVLARRGERDQRHQQRRHQAARHDGRPAGEIVDADRGRAGRRAEDQPQALIAGLGGEVRHLQRATDDRELADGGRVGPPRCHRDRADGVARGPPAGARRRQQPECVGDEQVIQAAAADGDRDHHQRGHRADHAALRRQRRRPLQAAQSGPRHRGDIAAGQTEGEHQHAAPHRGRVADAREPVVRDRQQGDQLQDHRHAEGQRDAGVEQDVDAGPIARHGRPRDCSLDGDRQSEIELALVADQHEEERPRAVGGEAERAHQHRGEHQRRRDRSSAAGGAGEDVGDQPSVRQ